MIFFVKEKFAAYTQIIKQRYSTLCVVDDLLSEITIQYRSELLSLCLAMIKAGHIIHPAHLYHGSSF